MVSRALSMGLRAWQLICAILVTAFMANNIDRATNGTHSIVNYSLFVGVWWLFTLLYFLPTSFIDKFSIPIVDVAMDGLSVLFGFCAAVALPAYLGVHRCSNRSYTMSNGVTNSSPNTEQNCRQAQATSAFLWFGWAAFVATLVINIMNGRGSGANLRGGIRRGGPSMSQV
ncbi:marvel domain-containing protein [Paraphoma chrysanthemicola]|nr:marvel domain-containing protein [Paraphoma chrysanthemicola]